MPADDDKDDPFDSDAWRKDNPNDPRNWFAPKGLPVAPSNELTRILNLPRRPVVTEGSPTANAMIEIAMQKYSRPRGDEARAREHEAAGRHDLAREVRGCACNRIREGTMRPQDPCVTRFLWAQAWTLHEISVARGCLSSANVGSGKTLSTLTAALAFKDCATALLLVPPTVLEQLKKDYLCAAEHFRMPRLVMHTGIKTSWRPDPDHHTNHTNEPVLHVLPYTGLSSTNASDRLENIRPDVIIADEVDSLSDINSTRVIRLRKYFEVYGDRTFFFGCTGTLTDKSISEWWHLALLALRERSPLPIDREVMSDWGRCIDANPNPCPPGALIRLLEPNESTELSSIRRAFRRRVAETSGMVMLGGTQTVVTPSGEDIGIRVIERLAPKVPDIILEAMDKIRNNLRPDTLIGSQEDEIIFDPMEQAKCVREIASGVMNYWSFPRAEPKALIKEWYSARKLWNSDVREKMLRGDTFLDSPALCENAARRAWKDDEPNPLLPDWRSDNWIRWRDVKDLVVPKPTVARLHPFLAEDAAAWGLSNRGIIWYSNIEFGSWVSEISGLPMFEGGRKAAEAIIKERGDRSMVASLKSHGRGRDRLQFIFHHQLVAQTPASSKIWEQCLGRLIRRGQSSTEVLTEVYAHLPELRKTLEQALRRSQYVFETMDNQHKLAQGWAGWDDQ